MKPAIALPSYHDGVPAVHLVDYRSAAGVERQWDQFYPSLLGASTIGSVATTNEVLHEVVDVLSKIDCDSYTGYLRAYYQQGLAAYGDRWQYADITTVLYAASRLLRPERYLEIGVRRGRSSCMVAAAHPSVDIVGFDMWVEDYGGMVNPGAEFVKSELARVGHMGSAEFVSGDSHQTVPEYFRRNPDSYFDMITVDGDHTLRGASMDLRDVLPYLKIGGVVIFDDIASPQAGFLRDVWRRYVGDDRRFSAWEFGELGFGIACAVRRY